MKPYYDDGQCVIYHGDCREVLPQLHGVADLVLTDPPYGISGGALQAMGRFKGDYSGAFNDTPEYVSSVVVPVIRDLIGAIPCVVLTPGNRCMGLYPQPQSFGVFYQPAAVAMQRFGNLDAQPIFYYGSAGGSRLGKPCSFVLTESPEQNGHPCVKPYSAWRRLLVGLPGDVVLDPFAGSGTTLRVAKDVQRRAIGIEIEERYCEISAKRLAQGVLPLEVS